MTVGQRLALAGRAVAYKDDTVQAVGPVAMSARVNTDHANAGVINVAVTFEPKTCGAEGDVISVFDIIVV